MTRDKDHTANTKKSNAKPISLHPLRVEQVVKAMLETPPPKEKQKKQGSDEQSTQPPT